MLGRTFTTAMCIFQSVDQTDSGAVISFQWVDYSFSSVVDVQVSNLEYEP